jgi:hypothetical protein
MKQARHPLSLTALHPDPHVVLLVADVALDEANAKPRRVAGLSQLSTASCTTRVGNRSAAAMQNRARRHYPREGARLVSLGATRLHTVVEEGLDHYAVAMTDPEGNESTSTSRW